MANDRAYRVEQANKCMLEAKEAFANGTQGKSTMLGEAVSRARNYDVLKTVVDLWPSFEAMQIAS